MQPSRTDMYDLTPIWVPEEPPTKRAKTNLVQNPSITDVKMSDEDTWNDKGSSKNGDSDSSSSN